jgi:hypothetical protein
VLLRLIKLLWRTEPLSGLFTGLERLPAIAKEHDCSIDDAGKIWLNSFLTPEMQREAERHAYCVSRLAQWLNTSETRAETFLRASDSDSMILFRKGNTIPRNELH